MGSYRNCQKNKIILIEIGGILKAKDSEKIVCRKRENFVEKMTDIPLIQKMVRKFQRKGKSFTEEKIPANLKKKIGIR